MAGHPDSRTTSLYDRNRDNLTVEAVERIRFARQVSTPSLGCKSEPHNSNCYDPPRRLGCKIDHP